MKKLRLSLAIYGLGLIALVSTAFASDYSKELELKTFSNKQVIGCDELKNSSGPPGLVATYKAAEKTKIKNVKTSDVPGDTVKIAAIPEKSYSGVISKEKDQNIAELAMQKPGCTSISSVHAAGPPGYVQISGWHISLLKLLDIVKISNFN